MPRYFFHVYDELVLRDEDGIEFSGEEAARDAALAGVRALICDQVKAGRLNLNYRIEVEDESGGALFTLPFAEAVTIESQAS